MSGEISRAESAETSLSTALSGEVSRAESAETSLSTAMSGEISRAESAETSLSTSISNEVSRVNSAFSGDTGYIAALSVGSTTSVTQGIVVGNPDAGETQVAINTAGDGDVMAGSFTSASDARLKKDVEEISNGLDVVLQMRPVTYNWINGRKNLNPDHKEVGFIAQELEALFPNVVRTMPEGEGQVENQKTVAYDRVVSVIVAAIKELNAKVEAMKAAMKA